MPLILLWMKTRPEQFLSKSPNIRYCLPAIWLAWMVLPPAPLSAQTFRLSSASGSRGDQITLELQLKSPPAKKPLGLQWEAKVPKAALAWRNDRISIGPSAEAAGKKLTCAMSEDAGALTAKCILAGGQAPIPDGTVAFLRFLIPMNAPPGSVPVRIENGLAVSTNIERIPVGPVEATVAIRR